MSNPSTPALTSVQAPRLCVSLSRAGVRPLRSEPLIMPHAQLYCSYCGKRLSRGEDHCYRCGHTAADALDQPPEAPRLRDGAASPARRRERTFRRKPLRPEDLAALQQWPDDAPDPDGRFCRYCGKSLHAGEYHCYKCGRSTHDSLEHPPSELVIKGASVSVEDLRDRRTPPAYFLIGALLVLLVLVPPIYYGVWVLPHRKTLQVRPAIADQPLAPVKNPQAIIHPPRQDRPSGPVQSRDDALARVSELWEVKQWLADMRAAGVEAGVAVADEDQDSYLVQVFQLQGEGEDTTPATMGWYRVDKATGKISSPDRQAPQQSPLTDKLRQLARSAVSLRPDLVEVTVADDWAFAEVAETDPSGNPVRSAAVLLRQQQGRWRVVATGNPAQWELYRSQMSPSTQSALDAWLVNRFLPSG